MHRYGRVVLNGNSLAIDDVVRVARERRAVLLSKESIHNIERSRDVLEHFVHGGKTIYGVTTGFGALSNTRITMGQAAQLQTNLLRSHATGVGECLSTDILRAMMLLRLNTLAKGFSGVRVIVAKTLQSFLNARIHPMVPANGSVGASGDLAPLAHMALSLIGEGDVELQGKIVPAIEALRRVKIPPIKLTMKEGLALTNGTQMSSATAVLLVHDSSQLLKIADTATAMSLEALRGFVQPFDARIHRVRPFKGQKDSAHNIRLLIERSKLVRDKAAGKDEPVQDAYSIRCSPQILGSAREAVGFARKIVETEINSASDNPLVFPSAVMSGGNFHGQIVGLSVDLVSIALATVSNLSERHAFRLLTPVLNNGLPPFLVGSLEGQGLSSGLMVTQYTAAALASENKVLAHPATVDTIPTSGDMEDFVSMSAHAELKCRKIIQNARRILAIELICAAQGLDFRGPKKCGKGTKTAHKEIRTKVDTLREDRSMSANIERLQASFRMGVFLRLWNVKSDSCVKLGNGVEPHLVGSNPTGSTIRGTIEEFWMKPGSWANDRAGQLTNRCFLR